MVVIIIVLFHLQSLYSICRVLKRCISFALIQPSWLTGRKKSQSHSLRLTIPSKSHSSMLREILSLSLSLPLSLSLGMGKGWGEKVKDPHDVGQLVSQSEQQSATSQLITSFLCRWRRFGGLRYASFASVRFKQTTLRFPRFRQASQTIRPSLSMHPTFRERACFSRW